jgi:hypothetical protein
MTVGRYKHNHDSYSIEEFKKKLEDNALLKKMQKNRRKDSIFQDSQGMREADIQGAIDFEQSKAASADPSKEAPISPVSDKSGTSDASETSDKETDKDAAAAKMQALKSGTDAIVARDGETNTAASVAKHSVAGATTGAALGGGVGAAVGAVVGGAVGGLKARAARKKAEAAARAAAEEKRRQELMMIEQQRVERVNAAITTMGARLSSALRVPVTRI